MVEAKNVARVHTHIYIRYLVNKKIKEYKKE